MRRGFSAENLTNTIGIVFGFSNTDQIFCRVKRKNRLKVGLRVRYKNSVGLRTTCYDTNLDLRAAVSTTYQAPRYVLKQRRLPLSTISYVRIAKRSPPPKVTLTAYVRRIVVKELTPFYCVGLIQYCEGVIPSL